VSALFGFGSPLVTTIWALSMVTFFWWLIRQLLLRKLVTILSTLLVFGFFLPVLVQYPFVFSPVNVLAVGQDNYLRYLSHVDSAFMISLAGMGMFIAGYALCGRNSSPFLPLTLVGTGIQAWTQNAFLLLSSLFLLLLFGLLSALGLIGPEGTRNIAQSIPGLRPFSNVAQVMLPLTVALTLFVGIGRRRYFILALAIMNLGLAVLTGARSVAFAGVMTFALTYLVHASALRQLRIRTALKLIPVGAAVLVLVVYLGDVREGQYNLLRTVATLGLKLFYGNNFSDLRDFAWVKSSWDGQYYLGKTQLAGLLSFIPSALSSYRAEWNWGVVTTTMAGLDPTVNPGLRAGTYGEMYFNFGLTAVLLSGIVYGYAVRRVHNVITQAAETLPAEQARVKLLGGLVTANLLGSPLNTAGFFSVYITIAVLGGLQLLDYMARAIRTNDHILTSTAGSPSVP
jgi:hypothetical protein